MAQKIISVSISKGDKDFMKERFLSPSRLLQERITQIRDEMDPIMINKLKREVEHSEALKKKIEFLAKRQEKFFAVIGKKYGDKAIDEILEKI